MSKLAARSATAVLTGTLLFGILAAIAALDEFARLPFYRTLPAVGLLVNAIWLFLIFGDRIRLETLSGRLARLGSTAAALFSRCLVFAQQQFSQGSRSARPRNASFRRSSPQEIETALRKIHSVAWGYPSRNPFIDCVNPTEQLNEEVRQ